MIHAAVLRLCISLVALCILFLMPSLLLYFLGYGPINKFNREDHETICQVADMKFITDTKCTRRCNCHTFCHPVGKYTSCTTSCSTCTYTCYYTLETLRVTKVDGTLFNYQLQYGNRFDNLAAGQSQFAEAQKHVNETYKCYYNDKESPIKVQFTEESDQGFYIATAVVGGIGGFCFLIHVIIEIYWCWLYRGENVEKDIEMN